MRDAPSGTAEKDGSTSDPGFIGRWITRGTSEIVSIEGRRLLWSDGILWDVETYYPGFALMTRVDGERFAARLAAEGNLRWSDGDYWTRDIGRERAPLPVPGPRHLVVDPRCRSPVVQVPRLKLAGGR